MKEIISENSWQEIGDLFHSIVELPAAEREKALAEIANAGKRAQVAELLKADDEDVSFLQSSPLEAVNLSNAKIPERIGKYKILREIGRGGMGAVYLAEREDLKKRVAVKIIKRGMDTDEILRRFQTERQILANLEHANIARLIDGGVSDDGLPFLVMEYVAGEDLLDYCEDKNLSLVEKLNLFRKICAAVGYAHQNLVVHRDLKPSNILVAENGEPKLLDFGISKLLTSETDATGTATALGMMTPNYASPEQFRGETVSTATDVYSLGVILFELLTGELPYKIKSKRFEEAARIIAEAEPARPSSVIQNSKFKTQNSEAADNYKFQTESSISANQKPKTKNQNYLTNPKSKIRNPKFLKGDLDNIILKALRKDAARRYATVEQFSEDIRRHLDGLPVTARPDTFSYRAEKFFKRNKIPVIGSAVFALALIGGIVGTSWQTVRAERQRALAEKRFGEVRQMANNVVFKYYSEAEKLDGSTKMREMMVTDATAYLDGLAQDAAGDETLQKELGLAYVRIGKVQGRAYFSNLGDTQTAVENYKKGINLLAPLALKNDEVKFQWDFVNALSALSAILRRQGNNREADEYQKQTNDLNEKLLAAKPDDLTYLTSSAYSYYFTADTLPIGLGEKDSVPTFLKCRNAAEKVIAVDPNHLRANNILAAAVQRLGSNYLSLARNAEELGDAPNAEKLTEQAGIYFRRAVELGDKMNKLQPNDQLYEGIVTAANFNLNEYFVMSKNYSEALRAAVEGQKIYEKQLAADPQNIENKLNITYVYNSLSIIRLRRGEFAEALQNYRLTIKIFEEIIAHDANNFDLRQKRWQAVYAYADELLRAGRIAEARQIYTEEFNLVEKPAEEKDAQFAGSMRGFMLAKTADCDLAEAKQANFPAAKRKEIYAAAAAKYQNALELWANGGAQISPGVTDAQRIEIVKKRLRQTADGG